jgi:spore maturation protein CgeB
MRILIVDPYYPEVLAALYDAQPQLTHAPYGAQWRAIMDLAFGTSDAYSFNLRTLGHDAHEIVPNCRPLQLAWAREHAPRLSRLPWRVAAEAILLAQAKWFRADVVYVQSIGAFRPAVLKALRRRATLLVGQIASALPQSRRVRIYDLLLTSFPHFVGRLDAPTELLRIGFDERVLERAKGPLRHDIVFIGQLGGHAHRPANAVVESAARRIPIEIWGPGVEEWPDGSPFRRRHHGTAWGLEMYRILRGARIAINRHNDASEGYANNMRLFEATGMGTLLLTDQLEGLDDLFTPEREVVAYADADDLVEKARWYLQREDERRAVAAAGHARTLREHGYGVRMFELVTILERHLGDVRG